MRYKKVVLNRDRLLHTAKEMIAWLKRIDATQDRLLRIDCDATSLCQGSSPDRKERFLNQTH